MSIRYLSEEVAAKIAAGEVIERPSSVVRELVDNALDARSSEITVKLESSGIKKIIVIDNGKGMDKDDLSIALDEHSTSKIQTLEDLYNIKTMGFRGEALYSINNVAKITITSNPDDSGIKPGFMTSFFNDYSIKPVAFKKGTRVEVEDIFYNIPARRKFLKSPLSELNAVKKVLFEKIFSYLPVSFSLYNEKKLIYSTTGEDNFEKAFFQVYKNEAPFSIKHYSEKLNDDVEITIYYSADDVFFSTRKYQMLFVNSRPVSVNFFYSALDAGVRNFISPGRHPVLFVYIDINPQLLDVNIHPAKREIKFYNQSDIFAMIQHCVARLYSRDIKRVLAYTPAETADNDKKQGLFIGEPGAAAHGSDRVLFDSPRVFYENKDNQQGSFEEKARVYEKEELSRQAYFAAISGRDMGIESERAGDGLEEKDIKRDYKILGVVFDTYIVIEYKSKVYFLDQHAVSETFLYLKKKEKYQGISDTESFVVPIVTQLSQLDDPILEKIDRLNTLGFDIEISEGSSIVIREVPSFLMNRKETAGIIDLICEFLENSRSINGEAIIDSLLITASCREAVKKGDKLGMIEIAELIEIFIRYNMTNCPHGRPVFFELEKEGLDKMFQRKK